MTIGNLRVLLLTDDGSWFAQGLEADYAAQGKSLADVTSRFEEGLFETSRAHLERFGDVGNLIQPAPAAMWRRLVKRAFQSDYVFDVTVREGAGIGATPFGGVAYLQEIRIGSASRTEALSEGSLDGTTNAEREPVVNTGMALAMLSNHAVEVTATNDRQILETKGVLTICKLPALINSHMLAWLERRFEVAIRDELSRLKR